MIHQAIEISLEHTPVGVNPNGWTPKLYTYVLDNSPEIDENRVRPAVIICPGGGYMMTSDREAEAVAIRLNALGFQAFVLQCGSRSLSARTGRTGAGRFDSTAACGGMACGPESNYGCRVFCRRSFGGKPRCILESFDFDRPVPG